ncbi:tripartite tricarboxylate transporter substrate binding protein [Roseomonas sp. AR75]|uniref:Bug family tripartite tricarboxylate transporter substrate binding protein n=1 Tax=Roseomonas sp. AR75 TaxID=2562311 RepID=UPI0010C14978|nr:tripartite tricarboxylate transporter substrate binding protein [Roseomonas sp. AR75]
MPRLSRRQMAALLALPLAAPARAQAFPTQPLRMIAPFPPGGPVDTFARILAPAMSDQLRQPVVVENRAGAGGIVGLEAVARAAPDGYTIGLGGPGALVVSQHLLPRMPYDTLRDFTPIAQAIGVPEILVVHPSVPARDIAALVALAKAQPGALNYASAGNGTFPHLAAELFKLRAGVDITHVPYRGAAPAITDLVAGRVQMMIADAPVVLPQIRSGNLIALGVASRARFEGLPDLPTIAQAGVVGIEADAWYALLGPAGIPADRLATLHGALVAALATPEVKRLLAAQGAHGIGDSPQDFAAHLRSEIAKWGEVVRSAGVKME